MLINSTIFAKDDKGKSLFSSENFTKFIIYVLSFASFWLPTISKKKYNVAYKIYVNKNKQAVLILKNSKTMLK